MEERRNQQKVFAAFDEELSRDRSPSKALHIPDFGLVVLTRKRVKQSLERTLGEPCPYCQGSAWVKSTATVCYEILDAVRKKMPDGSRPLTVRVNPEVARALKQEEAPVLRELEAMIRQSVNLKSDSGLHQEQFELTS
jgi:ribonuclease G